jgi:uncharacterized protein (DUF305 family)
LLNRLLMSCAALAAAGLLLVGACAPKGRAAVPYDLQFIDAMVTHHQGAIDMARSVESKALHPELREFARRIVDDQSREVAMMEQWRAQWFPGKPKAENLMAVPGMAESMKEMDVGHLEMLEGIEFDLMFIDMMVPHHEGAVAMAIDALTRTKRPEVRKLAQQIIDAQQAEIVVMKRWRSEWAAAR